MYRRAMVVAAAAFFLSLFAVPQEKPVQPDPWASAQDGVYCTSGGNRTRLDPISMSGGGATKIAKMFLPMGTPQIVFTYRGATSPVRIADPRPVFYVKQAQATQSVFYPGFSVRDLVVVR